jgi:hypothetical protein
VARFRFGRSSSQPQGQGGIRASGTDAFRLVVDYIKQETLSPLKGLGRYLVFGILGSIMLCGGLVLLLVALLRALQEETGTFFSGSMTWAPYLIVCGAAVVVMGLAAARIARGPAARRRPPAKQ